MLFRNFTENDVLIAVRDFTSEPSAGGSGITPILAAGTALAYLAPWIADRPLRLVDKTDSTPGLIAAGETLPILFGICRKNEVPRRQPSTFSPSKW